VKGLVSWHHEPETTQDSFHWNIVGRAWSFIYYLLKDGKSEKQPRRASAGKSLS
jgi:hypothetical protein